MNKKIIIIFSVIVSLLILVLIGLLVYVFAIKKDNNKTSTSSINYDNICSSISQQLGGNQGNNGNITPPTGMGTGSGSTSDIGQPPSTSGRPEMPSGNGQMTPPSGVPQNMGQMDNGDMEFMSFLRTACSDNKLSDEEKTQFDELYANLSDEAKERFNFSD